MQSSVSDMGSFCHSARLRAPILLDLSRYVLRCGDGDVHEDITCDIRQREIDASSRTALGRADEYIMYNLCDQRALEHTEH